MSRCRLLELRGAQLEGTRSPTAEDLAAPLPNKPLECVLRIDTQEPRDGKDVIDDQCHRDEAGNQREERRSCQCADH